MASVSSPRIKFLGSVLPFQVLYVCILRPTMAQFSECFFLSCVCIVGLKCRSVRGAEIFCMETVMMNWCCGKLIPTDLYTDIRQVKPVILARSVLCVSFNRFCPLGKQMTWIKAQHFPALIKTNPTLYGHVTDS